MGGVCQGSNTSLARRPLSFSAKNLEQRLPKGGVIVVACGIVAAPPLSFALQNAQ